MKKILIIDAFGLIFRAYYALIKRPLSTSSGIPTSAVFGFWKMIFKALKEIAPHETIIAFDSPGKSFRKEIYAAYKANREEAPEDLKIQIKTIVEMTQACGFPNLAVPGFEADDLIGFLCRRFSDENHEVYILSSDKDLSQLVNEKVRMAAPEKGIQELVFLDREKVFEKFGVYPEQIVDYLALTGDASDNIPGVKGIGPKTAEKLLSQWNSLEGIYENLERVSPAGVQEKLRQCKEEAFLSQKLASLKDQAPELDFNPGEGIWTETMIQKLSEEFKKLEFSGFFNDPYFQSLLKPKESSLFSPEETSLTAPQSLTAFSEDQVSYRLVLDLSEVKALVSEIQQAKFMVLDTETTSEKPHEARLIGFSLALKEKEAYYFPLFEGSPAQYSAADFFKEMGGVLSHAGIAKIGQNLKYDLEVLSNYAEIRGTAFDTMIAAWMLEPDARKYNMDDLALKYLNYSTIKYSDLVPKGQTLLEVPLEQVKNYACEDADITFRLYQHLKPLLAQNRLLTPFETLEMPLVPVLAKMEQNGIALNLETLKDLEFWLEDRIGELEKQIYAEAGMEFNLNSPRQLGEILFEKMGIPAVKKTKTGYSTDEGVLEELTAYPIARLMLSYRKYSKLLSTYVKSLPKFVFQGRVHAGFHQTGTATGRLASSEPNLQNIPVRDEAGKQIRRAFTAPKEKTLISADYSQIELRIMAHFSEDPALIQAFKDEMDIHKRTAALIFKTLPEKVTPEERQIAKSINFGIIYGMGPFKLAGETGISMKQAKEFIERYFEVFSGVKNFIEQAKEEARKNGYITTLLGRRRFLSYINSKNRNLRESDERMAINSIIQGSNADLMKRVMILLQDSLKSFEARLILQIHDELVFEVPENRVEDFCPFLAQEMEKALSLKVPLKVSLASGKNWGDLK